MGLADAFLLLADGAGVDLGCGAETALLEGWGEAVPCCCFAGVPEVFCLCKSRRHAQEDKDWKNQKDDTQQDAASELCRCGATQVIKL